MIYQTFIWKTYFNAVFRLYWPKNHYKLIKKQHISINSSRAFHWCMNFSYLDEKNCSYFFCEGSPYGQNGPKFFSDPDITIHTPIDSPCRVQLFPKFFELISDQKNLKNGVKFVFSNDGVRFVFSKLFIFIFFKALSKLMSTQFDTWNILIDLFDLWLLLKRIRELQKMQ